MQLKKCFDFGLFLIGNLLTCYIILASSNLQAQTNFLAFLESIETSATTEVSSPNPDIMARQGLEVVELIIKPWTPEPVSCVEQIESFSCPVDSPDQGPFKTDPAILIAAYSA